MTAGGLRLRGKKKLPQRTALASLVQQGLVLVRGSGRGERYLLQELAPSVEGAAAKILALSAGDASDSLLLWRTDELARALSAGERPLLGPALARLEENRHLLRLADGNRGERFLFAAPLRHWLGLAETTARSASGPDGITDLTAAYRRAVRESGGFPDVKISALARLLDPGIAAGLSGHLRALWQEGRVTLSLGDWSLASEEMQRAAVELAGERYLLVRFEQDDVTESFPA